MYQTQAGRESAAYMEVCEHLPEACAAPYRIKSDANPALAGQHSHWALDGVLKSLLTKYAIGITIR